MPIVPCIVQAQSPAPTTAPDVAVKTIRVQVVGSVSCPGNVEINEGDRLVIALTRAGITSNTTPTPDLSRVVLIRVDPATGKNVVYSVDVYQALRRGDQRYDPILRADDKIYVPEARPFIVRPTQIAYS
jgi:protein involved in polysaccharide export with SLBB domain